MQRHMSSSRRDADLDCLDEHGYFHRIDWAATVGSLPHRALRLAQQHRCLLFARGAGGRVDGVAETCILPGCEEHGTFDHIA